MNVFSLQITSFCKVLAARERELPDGWPTLAGLMSITDGWQWIKSTREIYQINRKRKITAYHSELSSYLVLLMNSSSAT